MYRDTTHRNKYKYICIHRICLPTLPNSVHQDVLEVAAMNIPNSCILFCK